MISDSVFCAVAVLGVCVTMLLLLLLLLHVRVLMCLPGGQPT
jgi:hypothetical protein